MHSKITQIVGVAKKASATYVKHPLMSNILYQTSHIMNLKHRFQKIRTFYY